MDYQELYEGFLYLDELREGGSINMFGATPILAMHLNIDRTRARGILHLWMKTYESDLDVEDRVDMALENITND